MGGRKQWQRWLPWAALGAVLVLLLTGCTVVGGTPQSASDPAADNARKIWDLFRPIFWLSVFVFVMVLGILLVAVVKFRRKPDQPLPRAIHGNTKLEIAWTLAPALILAIIAVPSISTIADLARNPGADALNIRVVGHQWWWEFQYPDDGNIVTADELHIPTDRPVHLELESADVIHSFWAPRLFGKQDVVPGRTNTINFTAPAESTGEYAGQCAEFCGIQHAHMAFRVIVQTPQEFDAWVKEQQQPPATPQPGSVEAQGHDLFFSVGCVACHTINGTNAKGVLGPNLTHVGSRGTLAGSIIENNTENLTKWVHNAPAVKPGTKMLPFTQLSNDQVSAIVAYLESLK